MSDATPPPPDATPPAPQARPAAHIERDRVGGDVAGDAVGAAAGKAVLGLADWARWSPRRQRVALTYMGVGAGIAVLFPFIASIGSALMINQAARLLGLRVAVPVVMVVAVVLGFVALYGGAHGTCRRTPIAPGAVVLGLLAGSMLPLALALWLALTQGGEAWWAVLGCVLSVPALVAGAKLGGERGLSVNLGKPQLGIGVLCAQCGYDLTGIPDHTRCPECGERMRYPRAGLPIA